MKRAVLLVNLGSPDSTEVIDVRKYLNEFLMDEKVIDKPWLVRALLVQGIITPLRAPKSAKAYRSIWTAEGSPLIVISKNQREELAKIIDEPVAIAMRYGNPTTKDAFEKLMAAQPGLEEVIMIPLYPQYAMSSYETAVEAVMKEHKKGNYPFRLTTIKPFYDNETYLEAMAGNMRSHLEGDWDHVLFSYHGIPERHVVKTDVTKNHCLRSGDCCSKDSPAHEFCYRHQCFTTSRKLTEKLGLPDGKWSVSFQSRLGRDPWLQPYTVARLEAMPKEGIKKLVMLCPAFVSDCLETLEEIAEEGKEIFMHAGGEKFTVIPCLNTNPEWIETMRHWIETYKAGDRGMVLEAVNDNQQRVPVDSIA